MLGDLRAREQVSACLSLLMEAIQRYGGSVIKTIGDAVMSSFSSADDALQAACRMQEVLAGHRQSGQMPLAVRIGIHYGIVIVEADDVFGDTVNVAAHVAGFAKADQILTTAETVKALAVRQQINTRHIDRMPVKGKQEEIDIHEVIWQEADLTAFGRRRFDPVATHFCLRVRFQEQEIILDQSRPMISLGRGKQNDVIVPSEFASRVHARIEYRRDKFVLRDQSTNGTYVRNQQGQEVRVHREELVLHGAGEVSLGQDLRTHPAEVIGFVCES
jgi:hypothetical protein